MTPEDDPLAKTIKTSPGTPLSANSTIDQALARYGGGSARAPGPPSAEAIRAMVKSLDSHMEGYSPGTYYTKKEKFFKPAESFEPSGAVIGYLRDAYPQTYTDNLPDYRLSDGDNLQSPEAFLYAMGFEMNNKILANLTDLQRKVESAASYYQDGRADGKNPWRVDKATKEYSGMINKSASTISAELARSKVKCLAPQRVQQADEVYAKMYQVHAKMAPGSSRHPPSVWYTFEVKAHRTLDYLINLAASSFGIDSNDYYPVIEIQYHNPKKTMGESFTRDVLSLVFRRGGRGSGNPEGPCGEGSSGTDPYEVEPADSTTDGEETYPADAAVTTTTDDAAPLAMSGWR